MLHAVSFALMDSVNLLLIGLVLACGIMLPKQGQYGRTVGLLIIGDWLGVLMLSLLTMLVFDSLGEWVDRFLDSPWMGIVLIVIGVLTAFGTKFGGDSTMLVKKLLTPLRAPSPKTFVTGFILGLVQSITSWPFFLGLAYLSAGDFHILVRYLGLFIYASLALSLPTMIAVLVGIVRHYPESPVGLLFETARARGDLLGDAAGYLIALLLILIGIFSL